METWYRTELPNHRLVDSQTVSQVLHHVQPRVSHLTNNNYCVNAGLGQESFKCENLCQAPPRTRPDHSKSRETVYLDHCHQTGPVSGGHRDRNVCQTIKCPKCGTYLPVGSRLNLFWNLGSLVGWTLGSTTIQSDPSQKSDES